MSRLHPDHPASGRHLVLIGLMGVGKTTVGRILADRLGRRLVDSDRHIETLTGRTVKQILSEDGVVELRRLEAAALFEALGDDEPTVIAAAGGVVLDAGHRRQMSEADAHVVWLDADPALLVSRTGHEPHRPWLDDDPSGTLQRMHAQRQPLYRQVASATLRVDGLTPARIADRIAA